MRKLTFALKIQQTDDVKSVLTAFVTRGKTDFSAFEVFALRLYFQKISKLDQNSFLTQAQQTLSTIKTLPQLYHILDTAFLDHVSSPAVAYTLLRTVIETARLG